MSSEPLRFGVCADIVDAYVKRRSSLNAYYQTLGARPVTGDKDTGTLSASLALPGSSGLKDADGRAGTSSRGRAVLDERRGA